MRGRRLTSWKGKSARLRKRLRRGLIKARKRTTELESWTRSYNRKIRNCLKNCTKCRCSWVNRLSRTRNKSHHWILSHPHKHKSRPRIHRGYRIIGTHLVGRSSLFQSRQLSRQTGNSHLNKITKNYSKNLNNTTTRLIPSTPRSMIRRLRMNLRRITVSSTWKNITKKHVKTKKWLTRL